MSRQKLWPTSKVSAEEMDELAELAKVTSKRAYAPYSKFKVGAAVYAEKPPTEGDLTTTRAVFSGSNIENANYTLTLHAEHAAIAKAVSTGFTRILACVIYTPTDTATPPCGSCRQVINEFGPDCVVVATSKGRLAPRWHITRLLPHAFGPHNLEE